MLCTQHRTFVNPKQSYEKAVLSCGNVNRMTQKVDSSKRHHKRKSFQLSSHYGALAMYTE